MSMHIYMCNIHSNESNSFLISLIEMIWINWIFQSSALFVMLFITIKTSDQLNQPAHCSSKFKTRISYITTIHLRSQKSCSNVSNKNNFHINFSSKRNQSELVWKDTWRMLWIFTSSLSYVRGDFDPQINYEKRNIESIYKVRIIIINNDKWKCFYAVSYFVRHFKMFQFQWVALFSFIFSMFFFRQRKPLLSIVARTAVYLLFLFFYYFVIGITVR